jgi:hypothetical protein
MQNKNNNEYYYDGVLTNHLQDKMKKLKQITKEIEDCNRILKNIEDSYPSGTSFEDYNDIGYKGMYMFYTSKKTGLLQNKHIITLGFIKELNSQIKYCQNILENIIESEAAGETVDGYTEENQVIYKDTITRINSYNSYKKELEVSLEQLKIDLSL